MRSRALGMNDPLGDAFSIEVSQLLQQVDILDQCSSPGTGGHRMLVISYRRSPASCEAAIIVSHEISHLSCCFVIRLSINPNIDR
ncbi:hypothetical protein D3C76_1595790 [compost metagenome]